MIDPKELRIGNLFEGFGEIHTVLGFIGRHTDDPQTLDNSVMVNGHWINPKDCIPIELTEEWLLNFGFEDDTIAFNKTPLTIDHWNDGDCAVFINGIGGGTKLSIQYVHQLQNLYFALTETELSIHQSEKP